MISKSIFEELFKEGPGNCCLTWINSQAGLVFLVASTRGVADLSPRVAIHLHQELHTLQEGIVFQTMVGFDTDPPFFSQTFLDPAETATLELLDALKRQTSFPIHFYVPGIPEPVLQVTAPWSETHRRTATVVLASIPKALASRPRGSFPKAKQALIRKHSWPSTEAIVTAFKLTPTVKASSLQSAQTDFVWGESAQGPHFKAGVLYDGLSTLVPTEVAYATWKLCAADLLAGLFPGEPERWRGIVALIPPGKLLCYAWPRKMDPMVGLRQVVEAEGERGQVMDGVIVAAVYAALQCLRAKIPTSKWSRVIEPFVSPTISLPLDRSGILPTKILKNRVSEWDGSLEGIPANPYDRARWQWLLGKMGWETPPRVLWTLLTAAMAAAYKTSTPWPWKVPVRNCGSIHAAKPTISGAIALWHMWAAFHLKDYAITSGAIDFLLPGRSACPAGTAIIEEGPAVTFGDVVIPTPDDPGYLVGIVREMLREVRDRQAYAPMGPLSIPIPDGTLLTAWGITRIRAWADPQGLWAALIADRDRVTHILRWEPREGFLQNWTLVADWARTTLEAFFATLWRDLCVAGPPAFPRGKARRAKGERKTSPRTRKPSPRYYDLPRRRGRQVKGWSPSKAPRQWGQPADRRAARKQARTFVPHRRVILYAAEQRANPLIAALSHEEAYVCFACVVSLQQPGRCPHCGQPVGKDNLITIQPPLQLWEGRLAQVTERHKWFALDRDADEIVWWETLLVAASVAQEGQKEAERLEIVHTVLTRAQENHLPRSDRTEDLHKWLLRGLQTVTRAQEEGIAEILPSLFEQLESARMAAEERAAKSNLPPPVAGYTIVTPPDKTRGAPPTERVVRARGLLSLYAALAWEEDP